MKNQKRKVGFNSQQGLTLIEVLVGLAIFATVMGSSLYAMTKAQQFSEDSRARLTAMNAARSVLETVKQTSLPSIPNINLNSFIPNSLQNGNITMNVGSETGDLNEDPIATITVVVSWTGPNNMTRSLELTTMRSQY